MRLGDVDELGEHGSVIRRPSAVVELAGELDEEEGVAAGKLHHLLDGTDRWRRGRRRDHERGCLIVGQTIEIEAHQPAGTSQRHHPRVELLR